MKFSRLYGPDGPTKWELASIVGQIERGEVIPDFDPRTLLGLNQDAESACGRGCVIQEGLCPLVQAELKTPPLIPDGSAIATGLRRCLTSLLSNEHEGEL